MEGEILDGKYRVEHPLGAGAMGIVVAARHLQLDERVAIKLLRDDYADSEEFTARFLQEGRAMIKIRSEHVVRVLDVGTLGERTPFLVMEYLDGSDLDSLLAARGAFPTEEAIDLVLQGIEAIAEAHALGIVHRDLKPGNLFLTTRRDGSPCLKVLDFGISMFDRPVPGQERITQATSVMGSPAYMSPEQMRATRDVDARTDVWALGVVLYEMLTGTPPFVGRTGPEVCASVLEAFPRSMRVLQPSLHPEVERAVHRCLEKNPTRRFANVAELALALAPFGTAAAARSAETAARVLGVSTVAQSTPRLSPGSSGGHPSLPLRASAWVKEGKDGTLVSGILDVQPRPSPRRRMTLVAAAIGVAALASVAMTPLASSKSSADVRASAAPRTYLTFEVDRDAGAPHVTKVVTTTPDDPAAGLFDERK